MDFGQAVQKDQNNLFSRALRGQSMCEGTDVRVLFGVGSLNVYAPSIVYFL